MQCKSVKSLRTDEPFAASGTPGDLTWLDDFLTSKKAQNDQLAPILRWQALPLNLSTALQKLSKSTAVLQPRLFRWVGGGMGGISPFSCFVAIDLSILM